MKRISVNLRSLSFLKILFLSIIIIISGCKKDEDVQEDVQDAAPDFQWSDAKFTTDPPSSLTPNLINNIGQNAPSSVYNEISSHLMQIDSYWSMSTAMLSTLQYMPGVQEENGNSMRTSSPSPATWTWVSPPFTITYTYNNSGSQYVYSYTVDYLDPITNITCTYYDINGWEDINGSTGHYEYNIDLSCMGSSTSPYNMTVDWQHSSGVYDLQVNYDPMGIVDPIHFDEHINTITGDGYYYWYSNPNGNVISCPPPPAYPNQIHSSLSLEYECHWTNNGSSGSFTNYQNGGQTITWP